MFVPEFKAEASINVVNLDQVEMMRIGDCSQVLHERLRYDIVKNTTAVSVATEIIMKSHRTLDVSDLLGVTNAVAVMTTDCCHEFNRSGEHAIPYRTLVGVRGGGDWMTQRSRDRSYVYRLQPLGRELTSEECNAIYDASRVNQP